ncbi:hypothetical protein AB0N05_34385 [Nocardia sp. NPDC051030]|uniref:hypothetical protein n=1 Tax=Nocardia sp. NPDC051030 TaxID=3155162 RepID=UPI003427C92B
MQRGILAALAAVTVAMPLALTEQPAIAEPETPDRTEVVLEQDNGLVVSEVHLYDPLPASMGPRPAACDEITYLRYRFADGPTDAQKADKVFVMQPGAFAGAVSMDGVARAELRALRERGTTAEWWSYDRRPSCVADMTGIQEGSRTGDYHKAIDYYYNGAEINGRRFAGWPSYFQLNFLKQWGLPENVRDQYDLLTRELPDPAFRANNVYCGGHSHGGLAVGDFAAWDFGSGGRGLDQCKAFVGLDTVDKSDVANISADPVLSAVLEAAGGVQQAILDPVVTSGITPSSLNLGPFGGAAEFATLVAIAAQAAHQHPNEESDVLKLVPRDPAIELILRNFSNTTLDFVSGQNQLWSYRFTNEALFGVLVDNNTSPLGLLQSGVGGLEGPVAHKDHPTPDWLAQIAPIRPLVSFFGVNERVGPTDHNYLYTWRNYNDVAGLPYTTPDKEIVDIREWARQLASPYAYGAIEQGYAIKFLTDTALALTGTRTGDLAPIRYEQAAQAKPAVWILGTDSNVRYQLEIADVARPSTPSSDIVWCPGYTHTDVLSPAQETNSGTPECTVSALTEFLLNTPPTAGQPNR